MECSFQAFAILHSICNFFPVLKNSKCKWDFSEFLYMWTLNQILWVHQMCSLCLRMTNIRRNIRCSGAEGEGRQTSELKPFKTFVLYHLVSGFLREWTVRRGGEKARVSLKAGAVRGCSQSAPLRPALHPAVPLGSARRPGCSAAGWVGSKRKGRPSPSCLPARFAIGALTVSCVENTCEKLEMWVTWAFIRNWNHYVLGCWYTDTRLDLSRAFMGTVPVKGGIVGHTLEQAWWYIPRIKWSVRSPRALPSR